jgi:dienelactone hydrolase
MIEIILLLTAVLTAKETVSEPSEKPEAVIAAPQGQQDAVPDPAAIVSVEPVAEESPAELPVARGPLHRVANDFVAEKDPDLTAAARLGETPDDEVPAKAFGLQFVRTEQRFASQGNQVKLEVLRPDNDEKRPAILILHGASGIGDGAFYRGAAEIFAERGYVTFMPHYLAAEPSRSEPKATAKSKTKTAAKKQPATDPTPQGNVRAGFTVQQQILLDALDEMARNPYVDASRIGIFGMSLGGFHALNLSSRDYRVAAVVNMGGALRGNNMPESNRIAPVLALHGAKDSVVPVGRARQLAQQLKQHGIAHDLVIYADQGHFFRGKARQDAFQRSATFFSTYLDRPQSGPATARTGSTPARD